MLRDKITEDELAQLRRIDLAARALFAMADGRKYCPVCTRLTSVKHAKSCYMNALGEALFDGRNKDSATAEHP